MNSAPARRVADAKIHFVSLYGGYPVRRRQLRCSRDHQCGPVLVHQFFGTDPFPYALVPFENERWSLLNFGLTDLYGW